MTRLWGRSALVLLGVVGPGSAPAQLVPPARWGVEAPIRNAGPDARGGVTLASAPGTWRQLFGREASASSPELFPRLPEAQVIAAEGGLSGRIHLVVEDASARLHGEPRRVAEFPRCHWRLLGDFSQLGSAELCIELQFFRADGRHRTGALSKTLHGAPHEDAASGDGEVPAGSALVVPTLTLRGRPGASRVTAVVEALELDYSPGLRAVAARSPPLFDDDEPIAFEVQGLGLDRGEHTICYELVRIAPAPSSSQPLSRAKDLVAEGTLATWASFTGRAAAQLHFGGRSGAALEPGLYRLKARVVGAAPNALARAEAVAAVLPARAESSRSLWRDVRAALGPGARWVDASGEGIWFVRDAPSGATGAPFSSTDSPFGTKENNNNNSEERLFLACSARESRRLQLSGCEVLPGSPCYLEGEPVLLREARPDRSTNPR